MAAPASTFQRAFAGGELAPALAARADLQKYHQGLRTCRNFLVQRHGGVANRPGTRYVNTTKVNSAAVFLLRYVAAVAGESLLLEAGPGYLRFYKNGGLVTLTGVAAYDNAAQYHIGDITASGGVNYYCVKDGTGHAPPNTTYWYPMPGSILELPTVYGNEGFKWVQSGNVITLTSPLHPPYELIYYGLTQWVIQVVSTAPKVQPPTALGVVGGAAGTLSYYYRVTAAAVDTYEESLPTPQVQVTPILAPTPAAPNVLSWTAPASGPPAAEYYVYLDPFGNGTFGFIGTATGMTTFRDTGFIPDFAVTPPLPRILFNSTDNYPSTAAYYQQRRLFANTNLDPDAVFGSRTGLASNFNISSPLQDDDAITFKIAGNQHNPVRNLLGLSHGLVILTDAGEWIVVGGSTKTTSAVLTPSSIDAEQEAFVGADALTPVVVGNAILYVQARGAILRDLRFDQQVEGLGGRDLTLFAAHLVDGHMLQALDYAQTPHSIVWACRDDGVLLGLTYINEQEVWGWHRHDTGAAGRFEDVCVVAEPGEDAVYVLVRRTIGGAFVRYIERLERRTILDWAADSFFVDAGLSYSGAPATTISGLDHLNGQVVAVVADGVVIYNGDPAGAAAAEFTVTGGTISHVFAPAASIIHAGLPIQYADLELLDLDVGQAQVEIRDKMKRVGSLSVLLDASARTFQAGPDVAHLHQVRLLPTDQGSEQVPFTGQEELTVEGLFTKAGRVFIRHTDPLPFTVLGVLPNLILGG